MRPRFNLPTPPPRELPAFPSLRLLGIRIDCLTLADLLTYVATAVRGRVYVTILYVNVHCMNVHRADSAYAAILESASLVYCDGTGVRLAARLRKLPIPRRMTGADWIHDLCRLCVRHDFSLFLLGGLPGVAPVAAIALQTRYPGLRIAGTAAGFEAGDGTIRQINLTRPDVLLVGMGTPTQEKWIADHRSLIEVPVVWAVGALFDFVSGRIPRGPHWMTENGLEWLCRLVAEPKKLWRRYLIGIPWFFVRVLASAINRERRR